MALRHAVPHSDCMEAALTIIVVEQDRDRAMMIVDALRDAGQHRIAIIGSA